MRTVFLLVGVNGRSNQNGEFVDLKINEGLHEFHLDREAYFHPKAISSYDAYLAFKVGLMSEDSNQVDGFTFEKAQILAADFDQNGRVNSMDVVGILKEVVHLEDENHPDWLFYDSETDLSSINRNNSTIEEYFIKDVTDSNTVEFTGVLTGDVDGSWSSELENDFENSPELA